MTLFKANLQGSERIKVLALTVIACLGILYLAPKVLSNLHVRPEDYFDFELFWRAGRSWASGQNPYDGTLVPNGDGSARTEVSTWFYPPYWYPLIVPFGLMQFPIALTIWKVLNFVLLILSTHLVARSLADVTEKQSLPLFIGGIAFVSFMYSTAVTAWDGQSSILVYFGYSALIFGLLKHRPAMVVLALVCLALKPQIGLLAFVAVVALRQYRWTVIPAGMICILASTTVAITADLSGAIKGFLVNLTRHSEHSANTPAHLTGAVHILDSLFTLPNASIVAFVILSAGIVLTFVLFYRSPLNTPPDNGVNARRSITTLMLFIALSLFIVPLHYYDLLSLVAVFLMIIATPLDGRWITGVGMLLCYRPDFIWRAFGIAHPEEIILSHLISPGLLLILLGSTWDLWASRKLATPDSKIVNFPIS